MIERRKFLLSTSALSAAVASGSSNWLAMAGAAQRQPSIEMIDIRVISWKPPSYHGWPTLAHRKNGELLLAFSGGRESHVCPFGRLEWMRSRDNGHRLVRSFGGFSVGSIATSALEVVGLTNCAN